MRVILYIWAVLIAICLGLTANHAMAQPIVTESTSKAETTVKSPPPSAISPSITSINSFMCASGVGGAVQTQIFGISMGSTIRDYNCELILLSNALLGQRMTGVATTLLCQDARVWYAMWDTNVICPINGKIGQEAKLIWEQNPQWMPDRPKIR